MFDAIAIGRWVAIYIGLACLFAHALLSHRIGVAAMVFLALAAGFAFHRLGPGGESGPVRVYTKNLLYLNTDMAPIIADIRVTEPDIVVLQEVSPRNQNILDELQTILPHRSSCLWPGWTDMAILSRWPLDDASKRCSKDRALKAVSVLRPDGAFWMVGAHLQHPWPDIQWPLLDASAPVLENLDGKAIVAGDFNTLYWTAAAQKVGQMTGTHPIRTRRPTFFLWSVGLHLDHVWAAAGRAHVRPRFGSDHRGVLADVWP